MSRQRKIVTRTKTRNASSFSPLFLRETFSPSLCAFLRLSFFSFPMLSPNYMNINIKHTAIHHTHMHTQQKASDQQIMSASVRRIWPIEFHAKICHIFSAFVDDEIYRFLFSAFECIFGCVCCRCRQTATWLLQTRKYFVISRMCGVWASVNLKLVYIWCGEWRRSACFDFVHISSHGRRYCHQS